MKPHPVLITICFGLWIMGLSSANGVDVYSNLGQPDSSSNAAIGYNNVASFDVYYAQGFSTGSAIYQLNSVDLPLGVSNAGNGSPLLRIYSDNTGAPGTDLGAVFTNPVFGASSLYNLSLATPYTLAASTNYWFVLSDATAASQTKFNWYYSDQFSTPTAQNGSGFTFLSGSRSINGGTAWVANNTFALTGITVNATAVPEPSTYALGAIATGVMACLARRRKARAA